MDVGHGTGGDAARFAPFVPALATELASRRRIPCHTAVDGAMLSADISGFTALSERLATRGRAGAEQITELVNRCFIALIDAAYLRGGEVLKFGGDALLILFRGERAGERAVDAGLAMQRALTESTAARRAKLSMTVGIAEGPFDVYLAGTGYCELLVTGPRASEVIRLEGAAERGDTLVSPALAALLPVTMIVRAEHGGALVAGSLDLRAPIGRRPADDTGHERFVPDAVRAQFDAFARLGGEHRLVTVGFLMVTGVEALTQQRGPDVVAAAFSDLVDHVVRVCTPFGVTLLHTDIAADGVKFVLCAGAPTTLGDTGEAMLHAALGIATSTSPFVLRQGVQSGHVFAGFLGSEHRHTYTLMGDPVNTAARMLGRAADREIVAVGSVVEATRTVFVTEELEPFHVKGKLVPIVAHKVRAASSAARVTGRHALVGREDELRRIAEALERGGSSVVITGQAGVGKSRLLEAVRELVGAEAVLRAACTPYGAATPYGAVRPLLRVVAGLAADVDPGTAGEALSVTLEQVAPDLVPVLPLLAVPLGAAVPPTAYVDAIDERFRQARIHTAVTSFLERVLDPTVLVVVEDVHWIDDASGQLLTHLVTTAGNRPWSSVLTRRPGGVWDPPRGDRVVDVELGVLTDDAVRALVIASATRSLSDRDLDSITARADGNPLFAIELALAASSGSEVLPSSIEALIATRIDALDPTVRRAVRIASVVGREFDAMTVAAVADEPVALGGEITTHLVEPHDRGRMRFVHALHRDVAYEGLPLRERRRLHGRVARRIIDTTPDGATAAPLLSLHFSAAGEHREAWRYSIEAAETAWAEHALVDATASLERAMRSAPYVRDLSTAERVDVVERLAEGYYVTGRFDDATRVLARARRWNVDPFAAVRLVHRQGLVHERRGDPRRARRCYRAALSGIPTGTTDPQWMRLRADIELADAGILATQGRDAEAYVVAQRALADAQASGDQAVQAVALERIHLALTYLRDDRAEAIGLESLDAHRRLGDLSGVSRVAINLGIEAYFAGDWNRAAALYGEALDAAVRTGDNVHAATAALNIAEILTDQGEWSRSLVLLADALRNFSAVGYSPGVANASYYEAVALMRSGDTAGARARLGPARQVLVDLDMHDTVEDLDTRIVELELLEGNPVVADADELLARLGPDHPLAARVQRARALALLLRGEPVAARAQLDAAIGAAAHDDFERLQCLRALRLVAGEGGAALAGDAAIHDIVSRLGIVTPTPLLPTLVTAGT